MHLLTATPVPLSATYILMTEETDVEGYFADCYVLSDRRDTQTIISFFNQFMPDWTGGNDDSIAFWGDGEGQSFQTSVDAFQWLEAHRTEPYWILSESTMDSTFKGIELYFTTDEHIVFGLYCDTRYPNTSIEDELLSVLKTYFNTSTGYIDYENPPPRTKQGFLSKVKKFQAERSNGVS